MSQIKDAGIYIDIYTSKRVDTSLAVTIQYKILHKIEDSQ